MRPIRNEDPALNSDAVINPSRGRSSPELGPVGVMASSDGDRQSLCRVLDLPGRKNRPLMLSRVCLPNRDGAGVTVAGPYIGAPYATLLLENLIAWGWKEVLVMGWCGGIARSVRAGDLILPDAAWVDEGTSGHYSPDAGSEMPALPSEDLTARLARELDHGGLEYARGQVWTTDAVFRETRRAVLDYQARGVLGVEMELSALFTVARFRGIRIAALLVVSDELGSLTWRPGFRDPGFRRQRGAACEVVAACAAALADRRPKGGNGVQERKQVRVVISGRVQGVCFRLETQREARRIGVVGWVRNRADGTVEAVIEGTAEEVDRLVSWCRRGPRLSRVAQVAVEERPASGNHAEFEITY